MAEVVHGRAQTPIQILEPFLADPLALAIEHERGKHLKRWDLLGSHGWRWLATLGHVLATGHQLHDELAFRLDAFLRPTLPLSADVVVDPFAPVRELEPVADAAQRRLAPDRAGARSRHTTIVTRAADQRPLPSIRRTPAGRPCLR